MAERNVYRVISQELSGLKIELNQILTLLMDRLDRLEGIRGTPKFYADVDFQSKALLNVKTPASNAEGANKSYVDASISGGLSDANPVIVGGATPAPGTGTRSSRNDHKHALDIIAAGARGGATLGTGLEVTGADTLRVIPSAATPTTVQDGTASAGTGTTPSRDDHQHPLALMSATVRGGAKLGTGLQLTGGGADTLGVKQQAGEADVSVTANIDGADTVAKATVLSALNALENKVNALISKLETAEILATV